MPLNSNVMRYGEVMRPSIQDVLRHVRERSTSPLFLSFCVSWCAWNYRFIVILFSDASVTKTFELIDRVAFPGEYDALLRGFLYPLISSIAFIYLYPPPALWVYEYWSKRQKMMLDLRRTIDGDTLLTVDETQKVWDEVRRRELELESAFGDRNQKSLQSSEAATSETVTGVVETSQATQHTTSEMLSLSESQEKILKMVSKQPDSAAEKELTKGTNPEKIKSEYDLGELTKGGYLKKDYEGGGRGYTYKLTHQGRAYLVRKNLL